MTEPVKQPWLSVIMPVYNGERYLASALESVLMQGDDDIECIAVNGDSTDATLRILESYKDRLPLQILSRERSSNWVMKTNQALTSARGKYICFLHHDDRWLDGRLKTMRRVVESHPDIIMLLHPSYYIDDQGRRVGLWTCPLRPYPNLVPRDVMVEKLLVQNFVSIIAPIFKREIALQVGGMDESLWYTADWDFWLKIVTCGDTLYYSRTLSEFRIHPNSQTIARSAETGDFRNQLEAVLKKHMDSWHAPVGPKHRIRKVAEFSLEVNVVLASRVHGQRLNLIQLLFAFLSLGPSGWQRYLRDSRIGQRVAARLRVQLKPPR